MPTLGEFHTLIKNEANQGSRLDSYIPEATRRAARFLEVNYSFLYMERFQQAELDVSGANPKFLPFPGNSTKKVNFVRYTQRAGTDPLRASHYVYLNRVDPIDISVIEVNQNPTAYWLTGDESGSRFLVLDRVPTTNLILEIHSVEYSTWPTNTSATNWLLENAEEAMIAKTMQRLARYAEEPEWVQFYAEPFEEGLRTVIMADEEARFAGTADGYKMVYRP
jgi:hypothetical protein